MQGALSGVIGFALDNHLSIFQRDIDQRGKRTLHFAFRPFDVDVRTLYIHLYTIRNDHW
jgi:hypothetical protein